jgi:hypothetical protein
MILDFAQYSEAPPALMLFVGERGSARGEYGCARRVDQSSQAWETSLTFSATSAM